MSWMRSFAVATRAFGLRPPQRLCILLKETPLQ
jgi:hypothetical protein